MKKSFFSSSFSYFFLMVQSSHIIFTIFFCCNSVVLIDGQGCSSTSDCGRNLSYPFWPKNDNLSRYCGNPGYGINCVSGKSFIIISDHVFSIKTIDYSRYTLTVIDVEFMKRTCPMPRGNCTFSGNKLDCAKNKTQLIYYSNCAPYPPSVPYISCLSGGSNDSRSYVFWDDRVPGFDWDGNCEDSFEIPALETSRNASDPSSVLGWILQEGFQLEWYPSEGCQNCTRSGGQCRYKENLYDVYCDCPDGSTTCRSKDYPPGSHRVPSGIDSKARGSPSMQVSPPPSLPSVAPPMKPSHAPPVIGDGARTRRPIIRKIIIGLLTGGGVGSLLLIILFAYRRKFSSISHLLYECRTTTSKNSNVDEFLQNYEHLALHRYSYWDLKKVTNGFKEKIGIGGYGAVFKGKLNNGSLVAVKVLSESKGNGEEFINEVATIGRTNHVNIVSLIGFCSEREKRALVYEYMPNGSLEKFIYNEKSTSETHPLGWEKLYQIALGTANGLEYLHRGCNTRILHFDIKPHNILLDNDFCPKISDFGMAKLCPTRESVVSMLNARGTIGYIAPEVYCKNFGGVSSKSDVYSYGMMLLEMVGGRKNINPTAENTSEIYFPHWVYDHLMQQENVGSGVSDEMFEVKNIRKMIIVGLWCIQTHPANRPSMSMVVDMLQRSVDDLQMPPNPFDDATSSQEMQLPVPPDPFHVSSTSYKSTS